MTDASTWRATKCGAPECGCRITNTSTPIAFNVSDVFKSDSPLLTLLVDAEMLMTSAPSDLPACSNDTRVLVLFSKKSV